MKILDIILEIDAYDTTRKTIQGDKSAPLKRVGFKADVNRRAIGVGQDASVFHSRDPHTVIKMQKRQHEPSKDGFSAFVNWLLKTPEAKNNIHFPRIYKQKKYINDEGEVSYNYEIEKLFGIEELSNKQLESVLEYIYGDNWIKIIKDGMNNGYFRNFEDVDFSGQDTEKSILDSFEDDELTYIIGTLLDPERQSFTKYIVNDEYKNAVRLLLKYAYGRNSVGSIDLHIGNIMYRLGPHVPIPVFSDPMYQTRGPVSQA